ncbi:MAG: glycosyltransferase [Nocardioides sp.]
MIGYYVHHVGAGHLNRARAVAAAMARRGGPPVTGLSSLAAPSDWPGPWLRLDRDDAELDPVDPTARGRLHWAPDGDSGLRARMAAISAWLETEHPDVLVSDVSVEVTLLARLHGVRVVSVVLPGDRGDGPHRTGHAVSSGLVACWPRQATGMVRGLAAAERDRMRHVGGLSRLPVHDRPAEPLRRTVLVLSGRGGGHASADLLEAAESDAAQWRWRVLGGTGEWVDDPTAAMDEADVVVIQAGESAVADVAACRRPAIVVPAARPYDEQVATAHALARGPWPCRVLPALGPTGWAPMLDEVAALDGRGWRSWCDGDAADRFAEHVASFARRSTRTAVRSA